MFGFGNKKNGLEFTGIEPIISRFETPEQLVEAFRMQYKGIPEGLVFEQGGFILDRPDGLFVALPRKVLNICETTGLGIFAKIDSGSVAMNRDEKLGVLLKVSRKAEALKEPVLTKLNMGEIKPIIYSHFVYANKILHQGNHGYVDVINKLVASKDVQFRDAQDIVRQLRNAEFQEAETDTTGRTIVDKYKYMPASLTLQSIGAPREILHSEQWLQANRTKSYIHTHIPTQGNWNDVVRGVLNDDRDELLTPSDMLVMEAEKGKTSSVILFGYDMKPKSVRTFYLDKLSAEEQVELFKLARETNPLAGYFYQDVTRANAEDFMRYYQLVQKGTKEGYDRAMAATSAADH